MSQQSSSTDPEVGPSPGVADMLSDVPFPSILNPTLCLPRQPGEPDFKVQETFPVIGGERLLYYGEFKIGSTIEWNNGVKGVVDHIFRKEVGGTWLIVAGLQTDIVDLNGQRHPVLTWVSVHEKRMQVVN